MVQRASYSRLRCRIAEEKQLLAEEKWIIEALTKIRKQRNCLQIERLELESLKTQLLLRNRPVISPPSSTTPSGSLPSETAVKMMTSSKAGNTLSELEQALPQDLVDDTFCNEQQLNLTVTDPIFSLNSNSMVEEEESDGSDEDDNPEAIFMDMNMFMDANNPAD